jgi:hypothetical protein
MSYKPLVGDNKRLALQLTQKCRFDLGAAARFCIKGAVAVMVCDAAGVFNKFVGEGRHRW